MDITPLTSKTSQVIEAYGNGGFTIAGTRYSHSVLVFGNETIAWAASANSITPDTLANVIQRAKDIELLLIGTGASFMPISAAVKGALRPHGISVDAMDTGAACRTFNVLLMEGRKVAAALIAV